MAKLESRLVNYLESITGEPPDLQGESGDRFASLPLFLRDRYRLYSVRLFGRECLLALEAPDWEAGSPAEYGAHAESLRSKLGEPVAMVIPTLPSYARNRMVRSGVPFVVPGNQMFLPFLAVDLRERFLRPHAAPINRLTPAAQCILLYHLLREPLDQLALREIASRVGYSAMMLTRAKDELEVAQLCESLRKGRSIVLRFPESGRALWTRAEPLLSSPVNKTHWVRWENPGPPALAAGLTALSRRSLIEDDRVPTYALLHETYRANLEKGLFHGCPGPSEATARIESWSYNPSLLSSDQTVDRLSLYLSLRNSADERVQQQLERLIEEVKW
jgi:DNA-binding MarR family transcriptional regulator